MLEDPAALISIAIFAVTFIFILTERIHRTVISFFGAIAMIVVGTFFGFYGFEEALAAIDGDTITLLFGMMILIALLEDTGMFQYLGIYVARLTKGIPWKLVIAFGSVTTLLSMVLDNVTTIILIVPITIVVARMLELNPVPILMSEALLSDVGGVATLVGDPPNIMIGSAAGFTFNDFLIHSLPVVAIAWFAVLATLRFTYREEMKQEPKGVDELLKLDPKDAIKEPIVLKKVLFVLALVVILFFLHGALHIPAALIALMGAALALILVSPRKDPQKILEKTELSVLVFFMSLFMLVGGLEAAGVLENLANVLVAGAGENLLMTAIILMWAAAIFSAIVDNIPLTVAMIPIIGFLGAQGVPIEILWWALALGVGFGGNGSPIGSTANVIVVSKSEQTDTPITFKHWLIKGTPTMFVALTVATIGFLLVPDHWMGQGEYHGFGKDVHAEAVIEDAHVEPGILEESHN